MCLSSTNIVFVKMELMVEKVEETPLVDQYKFKVELTDLSEDPLEMKEEPPYYTEIQPLTSLKTDIKLEADCDINSERCDSTNMDLNKIKDEPPDDDEFDDIEADISNLSGAEVKFEASEEHLQDDKGMSTINPTLSPSLSNEKMSESSTDLSDNQTVVDHFQNVVPAHSFTVICKKCNSEIDSNSAIYTSNSTDLDTYLRSVFEGELVLSYFEVHNNLSDHYANMVSELVIQREILSMLRLKEITTKNPLSRLGFSTSLLKEIAQDLSSRFGGRAGVYYSPGTTEGNNKINPSGKLHNQVGRARKQLIESGLLVTSTKQNSTTESRTTISSEENLKVLSNENIDDWNAVETAWKKSYDYRQQLRADKGDKLVEFGLFPCLNNKEAVALINHDFTSQFKEAKLLIDSWKEIQPTLKDFILSKRIDNFIHTNTIEELLDLPHSDKDAIILALLPDGIKSTTSSSAKRRKVDDTLPTNEKKKCIKESFVLNVESAENLETEIEKRRKSIIAGKETVYPFLVFVGPFSLPTEFYVVVDKIKYSCVSAIEALDLAFKIFCTTTRPFPKQSSNVWLFIKKALYRIKSQDKSSVPLQRALTFVEEKLNIKLD